MILKNAIEQEEVPHDVGKYLLETISGITLNTEMAYTKHASVFLNIGEYENRMNIVLKPYKTHDGRLFFYKYIKGDDLLVWRTR